MRREFSPSSWHDGGHAVDAAALDFAGAAGPLLGRLGNVTDTVAAPTTRTDAAVVQILVALNAAALQTVQGIADGLIAEGGVMAATGSAYERCEAANESLARAVGC